MSSPVTLETLPPALHARELAEFESLLASQGIQVPKDRRDGAFAVYLEVKRILKHLRQPRDAESEPANIFSLESILRE